MTPTSDDYKVEVNGPDLQFSRAIDGEAASLIVAVALGRATWAGPNVGRAASNDSLRAFLRGTRASNNPEKIAALAFYVADALGAPGLARDEVARLFICAGETPPQNLSRDLQGAIESELIEPVAESSDLYRVTRRGEAALAGRSLPEARSRKAPKPSASSSRRGPLFEIRRLIQEGWFRTPHTAKEILLLLRARGFDYKRTDLTRQLKSLAEREELYRSKGKSAVTGRRVWMYSAQQEELFAPVDHNRRQLPLSEDRPKDEKGRND